MDSQVCQTSCCLPGRAGGFPVIGQKKRMIRLETNVYLPRVLVANNCLMLLDIVALDDGKAYEARPQTEVYGVLEEL